MCSTAPTPRRSRRTRACKWSPSKHASIFWIEFTEQWDAKSPWHDKRLRLAVNLALDRKRINEAACLGFCPPAGVIVPRVMDFALQVEPPPYDPQKAKQLLAEAGYPERVRCRGVRRDSRLPDGGRGGRQRPERGRHPRQAAADGARGVLRRLAGEEAARAVHDRGRQLRQRRQPRRVVHPVQGRLRLRRLSRHRRALPPAGRRARRRRSARRCCTRSSSSRSSG